MHVFLLVLASGLGLQFRGFDDGDGALVRHVIRQPFESGLADKQMNHVRRDIIVGFGFPIQVPDNFRSGCHVFSFTFHPEMMATAANLDVHAPLNVLQVLIKLAAEGGQSALVYRV